MPRPGPSSRIRRITERHFAVLSLELVQQHPIPMDLRLECASGELLALVGPSGSGKSTVLRCIAGLHHAERGYIRCGGSAWFDAERRLRLPPQRRQVGMVFQHYALIPHLSARENVMLPLRALPSASAAKRADELLARVHLDGLGARRPAELSGGQQQRVALARALARALATENGVLLLDEPFSAVDQVTRAKLQRELAILRGELRIPMVLVTHDLAEARALADRMTLIARGRSLQTGKPHEVLTRPASVAVARQVVLTNLFEGVWRDGQLDWAGLRLDTTQTGREGERVCWAIAPEFVLLHRGDRPARGERENPVPGQIIECVALGAETSIVMRPTHAPAQPLALAVPTHSARRNQLAAGSMVSVSLLAEGIHPMPFEALGD
ncbi:MAG: ABC transporter ATP-binding protein [Rhodocyclaceae bacterium]|nr:ABC transporter ATP-binding protein [Rhodocyclaceae bacterium]MBX3667609.1 ABC transporter ATP-binding protein [Rhodocyclaceae bacterium]